MDQNKEEERIISGEDMLNELDFPSYSAIPFVKCTRDNFSKALNLLIEHFQIASKVKKKTKSNVVIKILYGRCVTDLVAGFHLATHGYPNQFFSITRSILENLDLIELFESNENEVLRWLDLEDDSQTRFNEFRPAEVRKKLGKPPYDEIYGHFCEMGSHTSFASFQSFSAIAVKEGQPNRLHIQIGPTDFLYPIIFSLGFAFLQLFSITISLIKHLPLEGEQTKRILKSQLEYMEQAFSECIRPELEQAKDKDMTLMDGILESMQDVKERVEKILQNKEATK